MNKHFAEISGNLSNWLRFNPALISLANPAQKDALIAAIDCTFLPKSGKAAYGLDRFWSGAASQTLRGLEASVRCL